MQAILWVQPDWVGQIRVCTFILLTMPSGLTGGSGYTKSQITERPSDMGLSTCHQLHQSTSVLHAEEQFQLTFECVFMAMHLRRRMCPNSQPSSRIQIRIVCDLLCQPDFDEGGFDMA
ncbi:hypothetical protein EDB19DRAFT_744678 [Suillus lakei]|nr:hypothetical protein EDB19DRAFT_744678 [Suillus lakei]